MKFPDKITIVGVGLIGGSIALGLKMHLASKITIVGLCSDTKRAKLAQEKGLIDQAIFGLKNIPKTTALVILATPISSILEILPQLSKIVARNCLIVDVGSTKEMIVGLAESKLPVLPFIGTHPMAGSDSSGFENADPFLFQNKPWIICPTKNIKKGQLKIVEKIVEILGAKKIILSASQHDQMVSFASHLSLVISSILISTVAKQTQWKRIAQIASTGFRDTTRLGSHHPQMKTDIVLSNKENLIKALAKTKIEIDRFVEVLHSGNTDNLFNYFNQTKITRDNWLSTYFN